MIVVVDQPLDIVGLQKATCRWSKLACHAPDCAHAVPSSISPLRPDVLSAQTFCLRTDHAGRPSNGPPLEGLPLVGFSQGSPILCS